MQIFWSNLVNLFVGSNSVCLFNWLSLVTVVIVFGNPLYNINKCIFNL